MLIELHACPFIVTVLRETLNTHDPEVIADWLRENLMGKMNVINLGSGTKVTFGGNNQMHNEVADALFMFEVYNDALHFQMRFIG